jgi:hypothetical protein
MCIVTVEISRPGKARHTHYAVAMEASRIGQARNTHLPSYRSNLMCLCVCVSVCVCVYYMYVVVPVVSVETRIMCTYVSYTVVLVPGDPLSSYSGNFSYWFSL